MRKRHKIKVSGVYKGEEMKREITLGILIILSLGIWGLKLSPNTPQAIGAELDVPRQIDTWVINTSPVLKAGERMDKGKWFDETTQTWKPSWAEWQPSLTKDVYIQGVHVMLDVDPWIGIDGTNNPGPLNDVWRTGRSAMGVEVSTTPNKFGMPGALTRKRVSVVVVQGKNLDGTAYTAFYGQNTDHELIMFPPGYARKITAGSKVFIHITAQNGAMATGMMYMTAKVIFYYFTL